MNTVYKKSYDIIFYYPQHFNRSKTGTNPFFNSLIEICEKNNLTYLLVEEPDSKSILPRNKNAYPFKIYFYFIILVRKITPLFIFTNFEKREQSIGSFFKNLTFGIFSANTIFTLSNSMGGFWRGYNPEARIIDYQHGIITKTQSGFFYNTITPLHITENKKEVAVWGKGFQDIFKKHDDYYLNKVHILGYYQTEEHIITSYNRENKILISLQFLPEFGDQLNKEMLDELYLQFNLFKKLLPENRPQIILKNHPRFNNAVDLKGLLNEFDFVSLMNPKESILTQGYLLHATFYSTTAFEMGMHGIPSFFMFTKNIMNGKTDFLDDFGYPTEQSNFLVDLWSNYIKDERTWILHSELVRKWSNKFFEPLDEKMFLNLVKPLHH